MKPLLSLSVVSGLFIAQSAFAAAPLVSTPITVTASRFPAGISESPVNVSVLNEQDIADSGAATLSQLLRQQASLGGLDLYGITGSKSRIDAGGFGATGRLNTLVLLNGRRLNDADMTGANLAAIPLNSVARVEILHGSSAVLYGDNAVGGVINIITKSGFEGPQASVAAGTGSYGTHTLAMNANLRNADNALMLSAQDVKSDGYRVNSAFDDKNLLAEIMHLVGDSHFGLRASAYRESTKLPGALNEPVYLLNPRESQGTQERAAEKQQSAELFFSGPRVAGELAYRTKNQTATVFGDTEADLDTYSFTPRYNYRAGRQKLIMGVDAYRSTLLTHAVFTGTFNSSDIRRDSLATYLSDTLDIGSGFSLQAGARRQQVRLDMSNTDFVALTTTTDERNDWLNAWDTTLAWQGKDLHVYARTAGSFRFPVLDEMWSYYYGTINILRPQRNRHLEIGARSGGSKAGIEANVFRILTKDEIGFNNLTYANENLDPAEHQGLNLTARLALSDLATLRLGYAYRIAHFRSGAYNGNDVPEIPRNSATLGVIMRITSRQQIGIDGVYTGKRYFGDDFANAGKQLPGHTRWNAYYHYAPATWKLGLAIDNLTNEKIADIGYYNPFATNPYYYYSLPERALRITAEKTF